MFDLGIQELIVIFIVALLVFGPKRLPELGKSLGKGLAELKKAVQDVKEQMDSELGSAGKPEKIDLAQHTADSPEDKPEEKHEKSESPAAGEEERKGQSAE